MSEGRRRTVVLVAALIGIAAVAAVAGFAVGRAGRSEPAAPATTTTAPAPSSTSTTSAPPEVAPSSLPPGQVRDGVRFQDLTIRQGVIDRQYLVLSPAAAAEGDDLPVVVVFHGLGVNRSAMATAGGWAAAVADHGFVAVFPQGILDSWNAGPCCPPAAVLGSDDVGFVDQVVAQVRARSEVDPERFFATGFSNGAIFTYRLACSRPEVFSTVAPVAGTNLSGCRPSRPVSLLHLHGNPDLVVPYDGAVVPAQLLASADFPPVPDSVAAWAEADGCDPGPDTVASGGVETATWRGCADDARVELVTYPGNGHTWPTTPVDGTEEILAFFGIA